jgi:pimeloyl-ACP methyl ester carboxylesterase/DNA-binding CsgD family transcriptional regulator
MEPQIRYLRTPDGVTLAYYEMGKGQPALWLDMPYSHVQVEWRQDQQGPRVYETVASQARLIRFDHRGFGLSDRDPKAYSLDAFVADIEAIVERLDLPPFIMLATRGPTTPIAVAYAAAHPEAVTDMVLFNAAPGIPPQMRQRLEDMVRIVEDDWRFACEGIARLTLGWDDEAGARAHADLLRASVDREGFCRWLGEYSSWDIWSLLPQVKARTLLTNTAGDPWFGEDVGRAMAAEMPDARCFIADAATAEARVMQTSIAVARFVGRVPDEPQASPAIATVESPTVALATGDAPGTPLTEREIEVLRLLASGLRTVETHVAHIYSKLGVSSRSAATAVALSRGLAESA